MSQTINLLNSTTIAPSHTLRQREKKNYSPFTIIALFFHNLSIRNKLLTLIISTIVATSLFIIYLYGNLSTILINSPLYHDIIQSHKVIAQTDVPHGNISAAYLNAILLSDPANIDRQATFVNMLNLEKEEFFSCRQYWKDSLPNGALRDALLNDASLPAIKFFTAVEKNLIPAIEAGNYTDARNTIDWYLTPWYDQHRSAIDNIVVQAERASRREEQMAISTLNTRLMYGGMATLVLLISLLFWGGIVTNAISRSVTRTAEHLSVLSTGDLRHRAVELNNNEIGMMFRCINLVMNNLSTMIAHIIRQACKVKSSVNTIDGLAREIGERAIITMDKTTALSAELTGMEKEAITIAHTVSEISTEMNRAASTATLMNSAVSDVARAAIEENCIVNSATKEIQYATAAMAQLRNDTHTIMKITEAIDTTAETIKMLSVNASIEAAVAGNFGLNFGAVAKEIKGLSVSTTEASQLIHQQVATITKGILNCDSSLRLLADIMTTVHHNAQITENRMQSLDTSIATITQNFHTISRAVSSVALTQIHSQKRITQFANNFHDINTLTSDTTNGLRLMQNSTMQLEQLSMQLTDSVSHFKLA